MGKLWRCCLLMTVVLLGACSAQKDPAEKAFAQLRASVDPVSAEMERYAPEEYAQLVEVMNDMKAKLNAKDYAGVLTMQPKAMAQLIATSGATAKRRIELQRELGATWKSLVVTVPKMLVDLGNRVAELHKKLPAGISAASVAQVEEQLGSLNTTWSAALASSKSGTLDAAVAKAKELKQQCTQLGAQIGLKFADQG